MPYGGIWILGYPVDAAAGLLDGTLKHHYCPRLLLNVFSPGHFRGMVDGMRGGRSNDSKTVQLTKRVLPLTPQKIGREVGVPRNLFPRLGFG